MKIKVTYPIRVGEKLYQPGEVIQVKNQDGLIYVEKDWGFEVKEQIDEALKMKAVIDGNRKKSE